MSVCDGCQKWRDCTLAGPDGVCYVPRPTYVPLMKRDEVVEPLGSMVAAREKFERGGL